MSGVTRSLDGAGDRPDKAFVLLIGVLDLVVFVGVGSGVDATKPDTDGTVEVPDGCIVELVVAVNALDETGKMHDGRKAAIVCLSDVAGVVDGG